MTRVTIHGWLPNGVAIDITEEDMPYIHALALANDWLAAGLLPAPPQPDDSERELIVTVMRRAKSDGTPIIDFYPEWGAANVDTPYGTYKFVHKYLNNEGDIDQFLAVSGFYSLEDIPLYDGQAPLKRSIGKPHPKETRAPLSFYAVRREGKEKLDSEGKPYHPWELVRYEAAPQQDRQNAPQSHQDAPNQGAGGQSAQVRQPDPNWTHKPDSVVRFIAAAQNAFDMNHGAVIEALRYVSFAELTNVDQYDDDDFHAWAACIAYACKYDPAMIAGRSDIAPGMKQLAIEMIELHEVPF